MKIENYYLDLDKVNSLKSQEEKDRIHSYYMDMMHFFSDKRESMGKSIFYTLYQSDFLKEVRDEKIEKVLS
jgi:hypothetical protein